MHAAYFREMRPYSVSEIEARLEVDAIETRAVIDALLNCGIIHCRTGDETDEEEGIEGEGANNRQRYQFRYVGIAIIHNHAIVCYPKYIRSTDEPINEMRQALSVISKLGKENKLLESLENGTHNDLLALMLRLLWLYDEYGIYTNFEESHMLNGFGFINWTRTIDAQIPMISNGMPVYLDYWTRKNTLNEHDLITRLHCAIISECSKYLTECGLSDLLEINHVELTEDSSSDFGESEHLQWIIDRERVGQYITWKQDVLDLMRLYLSEKGTEASKNLVLRLGTTSYYHAWEIACKTAFNDLLGYRLRNLHLQLKGKWLDRSDETLLQIIPRPIWVRPHGMSNTGEVGTLEPDTVTFATVNKQRLFCIYDAKYYVPSKRDKIQHQPGVESITKQFLYQSAYREFVDDFNFENTVNAFLIPAEIEKPKLLASVSFPGVMSGATSMSPRFSDRIDMWALPASVIFNCYLAGREIDAGTLKVMLSRATNKR